MIMENQMMKKLPNRNCYKKLKAVDQQCLKNVLEHLVGNLGS